MIARDALQVDFRLNLLPNIVVCNELIGNVPQCIFGWRSFDFEIDAELLDDVVDGEGRVYPGSYGVTFARCNAIGGN